MLTKRIIPCLDVTQGETVKGKNFIDLINVGNPIDLARRYYSEGADELVFLDITATNKDESLKSKLIKLIAKEVFIPFTIGGGVRSIEDIRTLLMSGADKVTINTAAVNNPGLIKRAVDQFGSQCIVVSMDVKLINSQWFVFTNGGTLNTKIQVKDWIQQIIQLGAGEVMITSIDRDGTKRGFDIKLYQYIDKFCSIPTIASGGGGCIDDFVEVFTKTNVDAALAATIFHFNEVTITEVKKKLQSEGLEVRF